MITSQHGLTNIDINNNINIDIDKTIETIIDTFKGEIDQFAPVLREYNLISTNFGQYHELSLYD